MLLLAMLSVMYSPSSWGFNELIRLFAGVAFFFIAGQALARQVVFDKFAIAFITVVSLPVVLAFLQAAKIIPFDYWDWIDGKQIGRASGTYDTPLSLVYFLMYTIPLTLYLLERRNSWPLRLSLGASLLALVFTYHRTAFIAITVELLIWFLLKGQYKLVLGLCAAGFLAVVLYAGAFSTLYEPLTDAVEGNVDVSGDEFLRGRGVIWATFLADYAQGNPIHWLIGRGGSVLNGTLFLDEMGENDPHNDFVRLLHDYGAIGIFAYLTVLWRLTTRARRFRGSNTFLDGIARLFLVSLVALLILSFTGEPMRYPSAVWYLFSLASILCYFDTPTRRLPALP
jgi:O-antigen ligase/polysaccharide polymerase Wzy-like membrane protein